MLNFHLGPGRGGFLFFATAVYHLIVVIFLEDDAWIGLVMRAGDVAVRHVIRAVDASKAQQQVAGVEHYPRTRSSCPELAHELLVVSDVIVAGPHHKWHVVLAMEQIGVRNIDTTSPAVVAIVIGLVAMVGKVEHHGVLVTPQVKDSLQHSIVIEGGVVILGYVSELFLIQVGVFSLDGVGCKLVIPFFLGISAHGMHMLPHQVEDVEIILARGLLGLVLEISD